jgi:hypothetical protein
MYSWSLGVSICILSQFCDSQSIYGSNLQEKRAGDKFDSPSQATVCSVPAFLWRDSPAGNHGTSVIGVSGGITRKSRSEEMEGSGHTILVWRVERDSVGDCAQFSKSLTK